MRRWFLLAFVCLLALVSVMVYRMTSLTSFTGASHLKVGEAVVELIGIADNDAERSLGLSNHPGLMPGQGLLFVFNTDGMYSFWMKDMTFSIDILWIDAGGKIVTIAQGVSPNTFPKAFTSDSPARYVLEVPAGFALTHGITVGTHVER